MDNVDSLNQIVINSESLLSLDHIEIAKIDDSILQRDTKPSKESLQQDENIKAMQEPFSITIVADDTNEQKKEEKKQEVIVASQYNQSPLLNREMESKNEEQNAPNEISTASLTKTMKKESLKRLPPSNPIESLLSVNFQNNVVLASRTRTAQSNQKEESVRTRDSLNSAYQNSYTAQYLKNE